MRAMKRFTMVQSQWPENPRNCSPKRGSMTWLPGRDEEFPGPCEPIENIDIEKGSSVYMRIATLVDIRLQ
jgi:hypothetical protein